MTPEIFAAVKITFKIPTKLVEVHLNIGGGCRKCTQSAAKGGGEILRKFSVPDWEDQTKHAHVSGTNTASPDLPALLSYGSLCFSSFPCYSPAAQRARAPLSHSKVRILPGSCSSPHCCGSLPPELCDCPGGSGSEEGWTETEAQGRKEVKFSVTQF